MKVSALKPNKSNPRQIKGEKLEALKRSVTNFEKMMSLRPIIVDEAGVILGGNMRYRAIKALGLKEIPDEWVKQVELTEDEKREFIAKDNIGFGEWDWDILANEWDAAELVEWGLDVPDFQAIEPESSDAEPQIDKAAELNKKWKVKTGDLWQIGEHRLLCGDATLLPIQGECVVSDPPYGINVDTSWLSALHIERGKPPNKSDDKLANDDGTLDLSFVFKAKQWLVFGFPYLARNEAFTGLLVWDKRGDGGENGLGNPVEVAASNCFNGYRLSRHVWAGYIKEAGETREAHPTQKPVGIMVDALQLTKGDVYEPFAGSGTTLVACQNLNRKCYAIEISENYCAVILERMQTAFPDLEIKRIGNETKSRAA